MFDPLLHVVFPGRFWWEFGARQSTTLCTAPVKRQARVSCSSGPSVAPASFSEPADWCSSRNSAPKNAIPRTAHTIRDAPHFRAQKRLRCIQRLWFTIIDMRQTTAERGGGHPGNVLKMSTNTPLSLRKPHTATEQARKPLRTSHKHSHVVTGHPGRKNEFSQQHLDTTAQFHRLADDRTAQIQPHRSSSIPRRLF